MNLEQKLFSVTETMQIISASRQSYYNEVNAGRLKSVKRGRRRLHTPRNIQNYFELLEREAESADKGRAA